jgi:hypothetical protein
VRSTEIVHAYYMSHLFQPPWFDYLDNMLIVKSVNYEIPHSATQLSISSYLLDPNALLSNLFSDILNTSVGTVTR